MAARYILDTHVVIWFLENSSEMGKDLREDIEYMQHEYFISDASLQEIIQLQKLNKISLKYPLIEILEQLRNANIMIYFNTQKEFFELEKLPMLSIDGARHADMIDRYIISLSIAYKHTLISRDRKFPHYRKYGLKLIEV